MTERDPVKSAQRVLKNYRNFLKVATLSDKPFSRQGDKLAKEVERSIQSLTDLPRAILDNQYMTTTKDKKSRQQFCKSYNITMAEYNKAREIALVKFAKIYRNGALLELK